MTSESTVWPKDWITIANSNQWGGIHCRKHLSWKLFMSIQAGFSLNCYFYIWLLFLSQGNMCTFLNMEAELAWIAPGKVFCIHESELIKKKKKGIHLGIEKWKDSGLLSNCI